MLIRSACVVSVLMVVIFCFKDRIFSVLLAPCESNFFVFESIRHILRLMHSNLSFYPNNIELITTDISSQFMAHLSVSLYAGILLASPYILFELMRYISPALYKNEQRYATRTLIVVYCLFLLGMLVSYIILFPISCRFLASYSVSSHVKAMISLDSYMSLFMSLTFLMGVVFQLPVIALLFSKMGLIDHHVMREYRKHAFILIVIVAAIITPPDIMTLLIVALPLYLLYEASIIGVKVSRRKSSAQLASA